MPGEHSPGIYVSQLALFVRKVCRSLISCGIPAFLYSPLMYSNRLIPSRLSIFAVVFGITADAPNTEYRKVPMANCQPRALLCIDKTGSFFVLVKSRSTGWPKNNRNPALSFLAFRVFEPPWLKNLHQAAFNKNKAAFPCGFVQCTNWPVSSACIHTYRWPAAP